MKALEIKSFLISIKILQFKSDFKEFNFIFYHLKAFEKKEFCYSKLTKSDFYFVKFPNFCHFFNFS